MSSTPASAAAVVEAATTVGTERAKGFFSASLIMKEAYRT